jgi:hypothetical protein
VATYEGTCRCGAGWTGERTAHCGGCHATFTTVGNFDKHRRGGLGCREPAGCGLVGRETRTGVRWHAPGADAEEAAQLVLDGLGRRFG